MTKLPTFDDSDDDEQPVSLFAAADRHVARAQRTVFDDEDDDDDEDAAPVVQRKKARKIVVGGDSDEEGESAAPSSSTAPGTAASSSTAQMDASKRRPKYYKSLKDLDFGDTGTSKDAADFKGEAGFEEAEQVDHRKKKREKEREERRKAKERRRQERKEKKRQERLKKKQEAGIKPGEGEGYSDAEEYEQDEDWSAEEDLSPPEEEDEDDGLVDLVQKPILRAKKGKRGRGVGEFEDVEGETDRKRDREEEADDDAEGEAEIIEASDRLNYNPYADVHDDVYSLFKEGDYIKMPMKDDMDKRPVYIAPNGRIFLETFSNAYENAYDFLISIAEPVCRPYFVHEYRLTPYSLFAASSIGLKQDDILDVLDKLSKSPIPDSVSNFIRVCTERYGRISLVLRDNNYMIESSDQQILNKMLNMTIIKRSLARGASLQTRKKDNIKDFKIAGFDHKKGGPPTEVKPDPDGETSEQNIGDDGKPEAMADEEAADDIMDVMKRLEKEDNEFESIGQHIFSFRIREEMVEETKNFCSRHYPLLEEYDFRNDKSSPDIGMQLKPIAHLRPYQEKSLAKMFGNGRARSGMICLPCGAGKTLTGVTAACTVNKRTVVLCTTAVAVDQWKNQFLLWTTIKERQIKRFTADYKEMPTEDSILISTYSMMSFSGKRAEEAQKVLDWISSHEWGIMLLDEVHFAPAKQFRKVVHNVKAHCKLGLTATLLREDDKINDLKYLIGPKLYEASWMDLQNKGYLARVKCAEVWCPMTGDFFKEYLKLSARKKVLTYVMNPTKFHAVKILVDHHEAMGDKILVFADNVFALREYAVKFERPYIYGGTPHAERIKILSLFKSDKSTLRTVFISKVGDNSFDMPDANVLIQVSSHYGARQQEAQRLGRILRPKKNTGPDEYNAFFYTLISKDTQEMYYSSKRQQFLIDQGYAFTVIPFERLKSRMDQATAETMPYATESEQRELLDVVLRANEAKLQAESDDEGDDYYSTAARAHGHRGHHKATAGGQSTRTAAAQKLKAREQISKLMGRRKLK
eukprot:Clim_evm6s20 gene=Clim_evmTU6s20